CTPRALTPRRPSCAATPARPRSSRPPGSPFPSPSRISRFCFRRSGGSRELLSRITHLLHVITIPRRRHLLERHEPQRRRVDAVPQPARLARPVLEHVAEMAVAVHRTPLGA